MITDHFQAAFSQQKKPFRIAIQQQQVFPCAAEPDCTTRYASFSQNLPSIQRNGIQRAIRSSEQLIPLHQQASRHSGKLMHTAHAAAVLRNQQRGQRWGETQRIEDSSEKRRAIYRPRHLQHFQASKRITGQKKYRSAFAACNRQNIAVKRQFMVY